MHSHPGLPFRRGAPAKSPTEGSGRRAHSKCKRAVTSTPILLFLLSSLFAACASGAISRATPSVVPVHYLNLHSKFATARPGQVDIPSGAGGRRPHPRHRGTSL